MKKRLIKFIGGGGNRRIASHNKGLSLFRDNNKINKKLDCFGLVEPHNDENITNPLDCALVAQSNVCAENKNTPSLVRGGWDGCYARSLLHQSLFLPSTLVEWFYPVGKKVAQSAPTSILPHKGGRGSHTYKIMSYSFPYQDSAEQKVTKCHVLREVLGWVLSRKGNTYDANKTSRKAAFTLAEVLVTLGIIGVVSAMTVPTLMQNYQRQSYVTQLHKVYNEMQQAALRYMTNKNAVDLIEAGLTNSTAMQTFFRENFKIVSMGTSDTDMPWNNVSYKNINGGSWTSHTWGCGQCAILASGAWICSDNPKCYTYSYGGYTSGYGTLFVDTNGKKGPNIIGRDAFLMEFWSDGVIDLPKVSPACRTFGVCDGASIEAIRNSGTACESSTGFGHQRCFANILNDNWEMKY